MHGNAKESLGPSKGWLKDSPMGRFGTRGIIYAENFTQTDGKIRKWMGIHAGRSYKDFLDRVTEGCIRLRFDRDMLKILNFIANDPLDNIEVTNNKGRQGTATLLEDQMELLNPYIPSDDPVWGHFDE